MSNSFIHRNRIINGVICGLQGPESYFQNSSLLSIFSLPGNAGTTFTIDERQGIIALAKELDREEQSEFGLVVMVTDSGIQPLTSTAEVKVRVTVSDNSPPKFYHSEIVTTIKVRG